MAPGNGAGYNEPVVSLPGSIPIDEQLTYLKKGLHELIREEDLREVKRLDEVASQQAFRQLQQAVQEVIP